MIYIGIDISKYKHDCFICKDTGEVIVENLSFENTKKGFQQFLDLLKPYDNSNVHIGLEATGHYGLNLKLFLEKNNYSFMEFNPLLVKEFYKSLTLRKTKTDKVDAIVICQKLMSVPYKPNSKLFYHKYSIKSLSRLRETLVKQRSKYMVQLTNILDVVFPEFKPFFNNRFSTTSLYLLTKYGNAEKIANMLDAGAAVVIRLIRPLPLQAAVDQGGEEVGERWAGEVVHQRVQHAVHVGEAEGDVKRQVH